MTRNAVYGLFSVVITAGIFAWLLSHVTLSEVAGLLRNVDPRGVALFLLASLSMSYFRAWRYRVMLRASGFAPGRIAMFLVVLVRNTLSDFLPARIGTLVYIYITTTRLGVPFGAATSSFALAFLFDMIALAPLIAWAAVGLGGGSLWLLAGFGGLLAGGMIAALFLLPFMIQWAERCVVRVRILGTARIGRWQAGLRAVVEDLRKAREAGIYGRVFVLSLMVRIFKYASLYLFLFALVAPLGYGWRALPPARVFAGLCAAEAAASLPISGIAGFGAYEGAWATVFRLLLFPAPLAKMTSIAHHLFTQVYGYLLGALALLALLLPFWRRSSPPRQLVPESAARFSARCAASLLLIGGLTFALYHLFPAAAAGREHPPAADPTPEEASALETLAARLDADVVFQRPDGIYMVRVGDTNPVLLAASGSYPRWSPDGEHVVFVRDRQIVLMRRDGSGQETIAEAAEPRAVAFHPGGGAVYFTDGSAIRAVDLQTRAVQEVVSGHRFRELDVAPAGRIVATVRARGVSMMGFDPAAGRSWRIAPGCSASFSPDGRQVTNNDGDHRTLALRDFETGRRVGSVSAPSGRAFDNQKWANHELWMVSRSEGAIEDVWAHDLLSNEAVRVTFIGACDRPDLYVKNGSLR